MTEPDTRYIETEKGPLFPNANTYTSDEDQFQGLDKDWVKTSFMIGDDQLNTYDEIGYYLAKNRYWSSAGNKFVDTRLGGNIGINPRPQFTRYADVRNPGRLQSRSRKSGNSGLRTDVTVGSVKGNLGMGRYYSEAIDDPSQVIYMRFGVPEYNTLTNFFSRAFDGQVSKIVKNGRVPLAYTAGKTVGSIGLFLAFPGAVLTLWGIKTLQRYFGEPSYKYYNLKPTMHYYWGTVTNLVETIAVNAGFVPKIFADDANAGQVVGRPYKIDPGYLQQLSEIAPDIFPEYKEDNNTLIPGSMLDMYKITNRAQRLANYMFKKEYEELDKTSPTDYTGYVRKVLNGNGYITNSFIDEPDGSPTLSAFINNFVIGKGGNNIYADKGDKSDGFEMNPRRRNLTEKEIKENETKGTVISEEDQAEAEKDKAGFMEYFNAEIRDGAQFAAFRVDHTGPVSESFSNATMESSVSQSLNSASSSARSASFSFMGGNVGGGIIGEAVQGAVGAVTDTALGFLSGVTAGFSDQLMAMLSGSGYIDIPKTWQNSNASLPRTNYTMSLVSPYGNVYSIMQNIYIPLCMLLAGALPRSTGKASYGPPFICQIFDKGRQQIKLGIIENLSITRGTSNLPFNLNGLSLAIDVSFTVADLSSIMHMPMGSGGLFASNVEMDSDNIISDYLAVLGGQDLNSQMYAFPRMKNRLAKDYLRVGRLTSPAYWASAVNDTMMNTFPLNVVHYAWSSAAADSSISVRNSANR